MKKFIIPIFILFTLCSCIKSEFNNITPVWCDGVVTAQLGKTKYSAQVTSNQDDLSFSFFEPSDLEEIKVRITDKSSEVILDDLSLKYESEISSLLSEFYDAVCYSINQEIIYNHYDDTYVSEFISNNIRWKIILDNEKRVISLKSQNLIYNIS